MTSRFSFLRCRGDEPASNRDLAIGTGRAACCRTMLNRRWRWVFVLLSWLPAAEARAALTRAPAAAPGERRAWRDRAAALAAAAAGSAARRRQRRQRWQRGRSRQVAARGQGGGGGAGGAGRWRAAWWRPARAAARARSRRRTRSSTAAAWCLSSTPRRCRRPTRFVTSAQFFRQDAGNISCTPAMPACGDPAAHRRQRCRGRDRPPGRAGRARADDAARSTATAASPTAPASTSRAPTAAASAPASRATSPRPPAPRSPPASQRWRRWSACSSTSNWPTPPAPSSASA